MEEKEIKSRNTSPKFDLTNQEFGYLTALYWIKGKGWRCKCICGNETTVSTAWLKNGHTTSCGCKRYATKNRVDMLGYENDYLTVIGSEDKVKGVSPKWVCKCKLCGREFLLSGSHIRNYNLKSCGCIHSQGEQRIIKLLDDNNIKYSKEYTFEYLRGINGGKLRFDFAVFNPDNTLSHLIEFNGLQHYKKPLGSWSNSYDNLVIHDKMKQDYCTKNNIELRIIKHDQQFTIDDLI